MKKGKIIKRMLAGVALLLVIIVVYAALYEAIGVSVLYKNAKRLIDENYDCIYSVFGDKIPSKEEYLTRMEEVRKTVHPFVVPFDLSSLFNLDAGLFKYENRVLLMTVFSGDTSIRNPSVDVSQTMIHELKHADDHEPLWDASISQGAKDIFIEGAASFWGFQSSSKNFIQDAYSSVTTEEEDGYETRIGSTNFTYGRYLYQYVMILALTDYDTIHQYNESGGNSDIIKEKITENYGINGKKFWNLAINAASDWDPNAKEYYFEQAEIFLNSCLIQDVEKVSSRDDALRMLNLYRYLKIFMLPRCYKDRVYCTGDYIDLDTIESALFEKVQEYGLLDELTSDPDEQRFIYDCLIYMPDDTDTNNLEYDEKYYNIQLIPLSITSLNLVFNSEKKTLQYIDPDTGAAYAQYVYGGRNETVDPDSTFDEPFEPIHGTEISFG